MYFSVLHGQATSSSSALSGAPTECRHGTYGACSPIRSSTAPPIRVITRMETTTYGLSVSSTPNIGCSASREPMQNGTTYMVRPRMQPRYSSVIVCFISAGSTQLLVGPASAGSAEQMKVRSLTRATSDGSVRAQKEFGLASPSRRTKVPASTNSSVRRPHSSSDPSHQTTRSGVVSSATSVTQATSPAWEVGAGTSPATVVGALMRISLWSTLTKVSA